MNCKGRNQRGRTGRIPGSRWSIQTDLLQPKKRTCSSSEFQVEGTQIFASVLPHYRILRWTCLSCRSSGNKSPFNKLFTVSWSQFCGPRSRPCSCATISKPLHMRYDCSKSWCVSWEDWSSMNMSNLWHCTQNKCSCSNCLNSVKRNSGEVETEQVRESGWSWES